MLSLPRALSLEAFASHESIVSPPRSSLLSEAIAMATAVLSPQHCLPFPHHHPHDSCLLETISDREIRNALSPPSPSSHRILFAPHPLRSSSSSEVHLCSRNNGVDIPSPSSSSSSSSSSSAYFSRSSFSNSRSSSSSSARLPILRSSERMHLSTCRRPFRIVHGNTTPNTGSSNSNFNPCLQKNGKKFPQVVARDALPSNNCSSLRLSKGADLVGDIRKRAQFDSLPRRETQIVKTGGSRILANRIDVSTYADGIRSKSEGATASIPPVRILQRSKTDDTLLAESGWKTEEQLGFHKSMPQKKEAIPGFQQSQLSSKSFSDAFSWNYSSTSSQSRPMKEYSHSNGEITGSRWQDPGRTPHTQRRNRNALPDQVDLAENGTDSFSIHSKEDERWAGPGFSNSPPPSSLPLPKFSLKQQRSYSLRLLTPEGSCLDSTVVQDERKIASAPSSPPSQPAFFWRDLPKGEAGVDIAFATKDLRRILHLDY